MIYLCIASICLLVYLEMHSAINVYYFFVLSLKIVCAWLRIYIYTKIQIQVCLLCCATRKLKLKIFLFELDVT